MTDAGQGNQTEKVYLNIESGSAKAMMANKSEWKNAPNNIDLYSGESLKTSSDGRASLTFSDMSIIRLEKDTEVELLQLSKKDGANRNEVGMENGKVWAKIEHMNNPDSRFSVSTPLLTIDTRGAVFSVEAPGTVYVIKGSVQVGIKYDDEIIKTVSVGIGQEFMVDQQIIIDLNEEIDHELIFALSNSFKTSNWYRWNIQKDGAISAFEESEDTQSANDESEMTTDEEGTTQDLTENTEEESTETVNAGRLVSVKKPSAESSTSKGTINIEGVLDTDKIETVYVEGKKAVISGNKWSVSAVALTTEGKNSLKIEAETTSGTKQEIDPLVVYYDKTAPAKPVITSPTLAEGEDSVEIDSVEQIIKGTVSDDTNAVIVNDYRLGKYVPGSGSFEYYAKVAYGNLKAGENEFLIYAEDKAGNQSDPTKIILILDQSVIDEAGMTTESATTEEESSDTNEKTEVYESVPVTKSTSTGGVKITSPNGGESFTTKETEFDITGEVPAETAKVVVNDYTLSQYTAGSTTFTYKARASFKNLIIGEKNTYKATAYDAEDNVLGSASITIDVESGLSAAPIITIPSSESTYSTTLDQVVIGGTVGKWISKVYINNEFISEYIPGSESWRKTVTLSPGENTFTVHGEQNGEATASSKITITYQP